MNTISNAFWRIFKYLRLVGIATLSIILTMSVSTSFVKAADALAAVELVGDAFKITTRGGRMLQGTDLKGATIGLHLAGFDEPVRVTFADIVPVPDSLDLKVLLYHVLVPSPAGGQPQELCAADLSGGHWAVPLKGSWTQDGMRKDDMGFTLACTATALGKCVRFGYPPWHTRPDGISLAPYHQACVHMVRAAYCGGRATTRDGMTIDYFDKLGIMLPARHEISVGLSFEAAWGVDGALCVAHTRVPEHETMDDVRADCPRLAGRLGTAECSLEAAQAGLYGPALLFNKSR